MPVLAEAALAALEEVDATRNERSRAEPKASAAENTDQNTPCRGEYGRIVGIGFRRPVDRVVGHHGGNLPAARRPDMAV